MIHIAHLSTAVTTLVVTVALSACSSTTSRIRASTSPERTSRARADGAPIGAARTDSVSIARARADSARYPWTEADAHFMSAMIAHHAQAVVMSELAPTRTNTSSIRTLAERIINAQVDEIASAQQWLRDRGRPVPDAPAAGTMMNHAGHEMSMAGMLTEAQMKQLDAARGNEFDRLFLTFMIQHHRGAVAMVHVLFGSRGAGQDQSVFKFASDVEADQGSEIARMEQMRSALPP